MAAPTKLSKEECESSLRRLNHSLGSHWVINSRPALCKAFVFDDFIQAWGFMCKIALHAESMGHHPEWSNVYNKVEIELTTHDAGGISELDFAFAQQVEKAI